MWRAHAARCRTTTHGSEQLLNLLFILAVPPGCQTWSFHLVLARPNCVEKLHVAHCPRVIMQPCAEQTQPCAEQTRLCAQLIQPCAEPTVQDQASKFARVWWTVVCAVRRAVLQGLVALCAGARYLRQVGQGIASNRPDKANRFFPPPGAQKSCRTGPPMQNPLPTGGGEGRVDLRPATQAACGHRGASALIERAPARLAGAHKTAPRRWHPLLAP